MEIAIQNPHFIVSRSSRTLHPYSIEFMESYCSVIFLYSLNLKSILSFLRWVFKNRIKLWKYKIVFSLRTLNRVSEVLVCLNGRPDLKRNCPPLGFSGQKYAHLMDYMYCAKEACDNLVDNDVDYVLGYTDHGKHDPFFRKVYAPYTDKCIGIPFSYASRFVDNKDFDGRINKCVAIGSINQVDSPYVNSGEWKDFVKFFEKKEKWAHKFRRMIVEHLKELKGEIDSYLPSSDMRQRWDYDIVAVLNSYKMFTTCESILFYPSVKVYEGCAVGSALVCSDHPCYDNFGFEDGVNCIKHKQFDIQDLKKKIIYYQNHPKELREIARKGYLLITEKYNPKAVADDLFKIITKRY